MPAVHGYIYCLGIVASSRFHDPMADFHHRPLNLHADQTFQLFRRHSLLSSFSKMSFSTFLFLLIHTSSLVLAGFSGERQIFNATFSGNGCPFPENDALLRPQLSSDTNVNAPFSQQVLARPYSAKPLVTLDHHFSTEQIRRLRRATYQPSHERPGKLPAQHFRYSPTGCQTPGDGGAV